MNYKFNSVSDNKRQSGLAMYSGAIFTIACILGILAPSIVNFALESTLSWALLPISSIIYAWLLVVPIFWFPKRRILFLLCRFTVLTLPFLYVLGFILGITDAVVYMGFRSAIAGIVFLWLVFLLFTLLKKHKNIAASITALLVIPLSWYVNYTTDIYLNGRAVLDIWDLSSYAVLILIAVALLFFKRRKPAQK